MAMLRYRVPASTTNLGHGFDCLGIGPWSMKQYFPGIVEHLRSAGNCVAVAQVHPTRAISQRATGADALCVFILNIRPSGGCRQFLLLFFVVVHCMVFLIA